MFKIDRIFSYFNRDSGLTDWFFNAREGIYGPYSSEEEASKFLKEFIKKNIALCDDGGRINPEQKRFSLIPKENSAGALRSVPSSKRREESHFNAKTTLTTTGSGTIAI